MFETNSRACDIGQLMKEGPLPPSPSDALLSLFPSPGSVPGSAPSHTPQPGSPRRSYYLLSPCLLLQALRRAVGSVSTPSAPISFFLLSPAFTASQVTSAGFSRIIPLTPVPTETHARWVLLLSPLYGGGNGLRLAGPLAPGKQRQILF